MILVMVFEDAMNRKKEYRSIHRKCQNGNGGSRVKDNELKNKIYPVNKIRKAGKQRIEK